MVDTQQTDIGDVRLLASIYGFTQVEADVVARAYAALAGDDSHWYLPMVDMIADCRSSHERRDLMVCMCGRIDAVDQGHGR